MVEDSCFYNNSTSYQFHYCTSAFCEGLPAQEYEVNCSAQNLNIYEPPSIYEYEEYSTLWEPITCYLWNVTYHNRQNLPDSYNFCSVPLQGADAFLFVSLALLAAAILFGKLSAVWVLVSGGVLGIVNYHANLLQVSNAVALWIGISPPDLFFYAFLPPLLVDSAIRIDFFMFRKLWVHILMLAFVMVVLSALVLTPLILFVLGFQGRGWSWVHGALFAAMISSTDALAAAAILKQGGGPEKLVVLMEGEALLNDASAITLFEVFIHILEQHKDPDVPWPSVWSVLPDIIRDICKLAAIGAGIGIGFSIATTYLLRWLRWRGAKPFIEVTVVLAIAYLSFYVANSPAHGSGVIAVVVYGLYGNATSKWGMLASAAESGAFDMVWDTISFGANGIVFFWSGVACINYFERSVSTLGYTGWSYGAIPLIWVFMMLIRGGCLTVFNLLFRLLGEPLSRADILFTTWSGLRGAVSLIMIADFVTVTNFSTGTEMDVVDADIALWTSAFVFLTLIVNAPTISTVLNLLKLNKIPREKLKMRSKAKRALLRFTDAAIANLRDDEGEFLQGANWDAVAQYVDMSRKLPRFDPPPDGVVPPSDRPGQLLYRCFGWVRGVLSPRRALTKPSRHMRQRQQAKREVHALGALTVDSVAGAAGAAAGAGVGALSMGVDHWVGKQKDQINGLLPGRTSLAPQQAQQQQEEEEEGAWGEEERLEKGWGPGLAGAGVTNGAGGRGAAPSRGSGEEEEERTNANRSSAAYDSDVESSSLSSGSGASSDSFTVGRRRPSESRAAAARRTRQELEGWLEDCPLVLAGGGHAGHAAGSRKPTRSGTDGSGGGGVAAGDAATGSKKGGSNGKDGRHDDGQHGQHAERDVEMGLWAGPTGAAADQLGGSTDAVAAGGAAQASSPFSAAAAGAAAAGMAVAAAVPSSSQEQPGAPDTGGIGGGSSSGRASYAQLESITEGQQLAMGTEAEEAGGMVAGEAVAGAGAAGAARERAGGRRAWHQQAPSSAQPVTSNVSALGAAGGTECPDYYSSMPAAVGRQLAQQLAAQRRATGGAESGSQGDEVVPAASVGSSGADRQQPLAALFAVHGGAGGEGGENGTNAAAAAPAVPAAGAAAATALDEGPGYYSSMPAAVGRQMQQALAQQLQHAKQALAQPAKQLLTLAPFPEAEEAAYYASLPAAKGRKVAQQARQAQQAQQDLPPFPEAEGAAYYSSLPAAAGEQVARQLQQLLTGKVPPPQQRAPTSPPPRPTSPHPPSPLGRGQQLSPRARDMAAGQEAEQLYYSSMPAGSRQQLAKQLQQQLAAAAAVSPPGSDATAAVPHAQQQQQQQDEQQHQGQGREELGSPGASTNAAPLRQSPSDQQLQGYYSSLPATAGRQLQAQLQAYLAAAADPAADALPSSPPQQQQQQQQQQQHVGGSGSAARAGDAAGVARPAAPVGQSRPPLPRVPGTAQQDQQAELVPTSLPSQPMHVSPPPVAAEPALPSAESPAESAGASPPAPGGVSHASSDADLQAAGGLSASSLIPASVRQTLQAALQAKLRQQRSPGREGSGSGSRPASRLGASPLGSSTSLTSLTAAEAAAEQQQESGSEAGSPPPVPAPAQPPAVSAGSPAGIAGAGERASPVGMAGPAGTAGSPAGVAGAAAPDHFSTMPAAVGQRMQRDLLRELQQSQQAQQAQQELRGPSRSSSAGREAPAPPATLAAPAPGARPPRPTFRELLPPGEPSALRPPAAPHRPAPWQHPKPLVRPPLPGKAGASGTAGTASKRLDHYATLSGATGASLAGELRRQLATSQGAGAPPFMAPAPIQRDLLGRKLPTSSSAAATQSGISPFAASGARPTASAAAAAAAAARLPADKHMLRGVSHRHHSRQGSGAGSTFSTPIVGASTPIADALFRTRSGRHIGGPAGDSPRSPRKVSAARAGSTASSLGSPRSPRGATSAGAGALGGTATAAAAGAGAAAAAMAEAATEGLKSSQDAFRHLTRQSMEAEDRRKADKAWQHTRRLTRTTASLPNTDGPAALLARMYTPASLAAGAVTGTAPTLDHVSPLMGSKAGSYVGDGSGHGGSGFVRVVSGQWDSSGHGGGGGGGGGDGLSGTFGASGTPGATSSAAPTVSTVDPQALAEMRSRLLAGLKRYFHAKRMEGLLSVQGMRILDYACELAAEHADQPLGLWARMEQEVKGAWWTRLAARSLHWTLVRMLRLPRWAQRVLGWPMQKLGDLLRALLGRAMLVACEVAVEYYLGLLHSPQIQWMKSTDDAWPLQAEVDAEVDAAYKFIIDREIEAPDRFQAIQSYRAAMALLRQQLTFVHELFEAGMVDGGESDYMQEPLDKKMRHLEIVGPVWRPPKPRSVLRSLPFMSSLPDSLFQLMFKEGTIKSYHSGLVVWSATDLVARTGGEQGPGVLVVVSGVLKRLFIGPDGTKKEYYQGIGGTVGVLLAMTGTRLPGTELALAEGNTLGKGPVVFHLPQSLCQRLRTLADSGDPGAALLQLQLLRLCALYVVECLDAQLVTAVERHLMDIAAAKAQRSFRRKQLPLAAPLQQEPPERSQQPPGQQAERGRAAGARRATAPPANMLLRRKSMGRLGGEEAAVFSPGAGRDEGTAPPPAAVPNAIGNRGAQLSNLMQMIAQLEFEDDDEDQDRPALGAVPESPGAGTRSLSPRARGGIGVDGYEEEAEVEEQERDGEALGAQDDHVAKRAAAATAAGMAGGGGKADSSKRLLGRFYSTKSGGDKDKGADAEADKAAIAGVQRRRHSVGSTGSAGSGARLVSWGADSQQGGGVGGDLAAPQGAGTGGQEAGVRKPPVSAQQFGERYVRAKSRSAARKAPMYAAEVLEELRRGVPAAEVYELPAGASWRQVSHAVLLRGNLVRAAPDWSADSLAGAAATAEEESRPPQQQHGGDGLPTGDGGSGGNGLPAPQILPWLWACHLRCASGARGVAPPYARWVAGEGGALLVVCLPEGGGELPDIEEGGGTLTLAGRPTDASSESAGVPGVVPRVSVAALSEELTPTQSQQSEQAPQARQSVQAERVNVSQRDSSPLRPGLRRIRTSMEGGLVPAG